MPTQLLLGPPGSGKTGACIKQIQETQTRQPLAKIWVLLPDGQNIAYFRKRFAEAGGGIRVNTGSFSALYRDILEKNGIFTPLISPSLEHRLVKETIDSAYAAGTLSHYAAIRDKPGFNLALQDIFSELRSAYISPERFIEYTQNGTTAKRELALLYEKFVTRLQELNWIDRDGQIWQAIEAMENNPQTMNDVQLVVVDGFSAFAAARLQFLKRLSEQVGEIRITLPGALHSDRQVHRRTQSEADLLIRELTPQVREIKQPPQLIPAICHLEAHVLEPGQFEQRTVSQPLFLEAASQTEETREALRWIKTLNKRQGVPLDACALFVGNLDTYRPLIRAAAQEFGVKVHFSHPESLEESPAIQSMLNLLQLPVEGFQTRSLFNALHSPYFDFGLTPQNIDDLETVSQHTHIVMGRDQWEEAWLAARQMNINDEDSDDQDRGYKNPLKEIDLEGLQNCFAAFWQIFSPIEETHSLEAWITWLENTLVDLQFYEYMTGDRDQEAGTSLGEALKALILSEQVAGVRKVDYATFLTDLQGALRGARLDEPRAGRRNTLLVGKITEARASRFSAVVLMGFSEGVFPVVENPDPFLDETLRADLGLEPRLGREQSSTFYQAFTRADQHLLFTRPYLVEDGEKWEPSPYWESAKNLFKKDALRKVSQNAQLRQSEAASPQELLFWAIKQDQLAYKTDPALLTRWEDLQSARRILGSRRAKKASGPYEGYPIQLASALSEKYAPIHPLSASRLETYGTCPFQFYIQQVLGLEPKEPPELGLDARQVGSILHRILELVYAHADEHADLDQLMSLLEEYANQVFRIAPKKYGFRPSPLWKVEQSQFLDTLQETIIALQDASKGWQPIGFEEKFGIDSAPPLTIALGDKKIILSGFIDRIDRNDSGELRVIDYKTGGSHLAKSDFEDGRRLQLPIYGLAAQEALGLGEVVEGFYWAIKDAKASSLKLSGVKTEDAEGFSAAQAVLRKHLVRIISGIHSGHFPPEPPHGGCPSYCPAAQFCWRYQAGW